MPTRQKVKLLILYPILILAVTGCVPRAVTKEITNAEAALEAAWEAEAPRYAPDEYNSAEDMLLQAHAEVKEKKYTEAKAAAISARKLAEIARDSALKNKLVDEKGGGFSEGEGIPRLGESGFTEEILAGATGKGALGEGITISQLSTIYFDFDEYILTEEAREILNENAEWMRENPRIKIKIEGHCDERGTVEYNLALGQKRADSTKDYLAILGIDPKQLSTVSYGEEVPVDPGQNELAWAKNRRAEFVIVR
jgi:peptidoglycan-associated lipoprotein